MKALEERRRLNPDKTNLFDIYGFSFTSSSANTSAVAHFRDCSVLSEIWRYSSVYSLKNIKGILMGLDYDDVIWGNRDALHIEHYVDIRLNNKKHLIFTVTVPLSRRCQVAIEQQVGARKERVDILGLTVRLEDVVANKAFSVDNSEFQSEKHRFFTDKGELINPRNSEWLWNYFERVDIDVGIWGKNHCLLDYMSPDFAHGIIKALLIA